MNVLDKHIVFLIGIGGIGMSALARWFNASGHEVIGYDKTRTTLTTSLSEEGIDVHYNELLEVIPEGASKKNTLVIYTPAVPDDQKQLVSFREQSFSVLKRSEVLGLISQKFYTVAIAGTHGKTTTATMLAHLLKTAKIDTVAFLGGISANYNTNLILNSTSGAIAVIEADEYDRSFLTLHPNIAVVTAVDADHLDVYGDKESLKKSFQSFLGKLREDGKILISDQANNILNTENACIYGIEKGSARAENIKIVKNTYQFDYVNGDHSIKNISLQIAGRHNTENAVVAIRIALILGVSVDLVKRGLASFIGVRRRFEYIVNTPNHVFIDDYAHHPEEIKAFLNSLIEMYPNKRIVAIFQPHLYSRTEGFVKEFAQSLKLADQVILMDIYPARELPIAGVTSYIIADLLSPDKVEVLKRDQILARVRDEMPELVATIGAGDIDTLVPEIKQLLESTQ